MAVLTVSGFVAFNAKYTPKTPWWRFGFRIVTDFFIFVGLFAKQPYRNIGCMRDDDYKILWCGNTRTLGDDDIKLNYKGYAPPLLLLHTVISSLY